MNPLSVYASKKLTPHERLYSIVEKECVVVVFADHKFHRYLYKVDISHCKRIVYIY